jgi:hypothetical protein
MKKEEFDNILKRTGLSRQEFSNITKVAYSTISNWQDDNKPIPLWVDSWFENYIKAKDIDKIIDAVKPYIKEK